jgi:hypothetical protein
VIAAATVSGGPGAGTGRDDKDQEGEGGGFGLTAKPTGTFVIAHGEVRWEPAIDVNRLVATGGAAAIAALFVALRIVKAKTRPQDLGYGRLISRPDATRPRSPR